MWRSCHYAKLQAVSDLASQQILSQRGFSHPSQEGPELLYQQVIHCAQALWQCLALPELGGLPLN